jgi:glucoamylase
MMVRSRKDGAVYDCIPQARQRYIIERTPSRVEMWTLAYQLVRIATGKVLRLIFDEPALVHWSFDDWKTVADTETRQVGPGLSFADLPSDHLTAGSKIVFTFRRVDRWEGKDFAVQVG